MGKVSALSAITDPSTGSLYIIDSGGDSKKITTENFQADTLASPSITGAATIATDCTLTAGDLVLSTSGKGIDFSATSDGPAMTGEVLTDYEDGAGAATWTAGGGGGVNDSKIIEYVKVGNDCRVSAQINYITSPAAGTIYLTLPFAVKNTSLGNFVGSAMCEGENDGGLICIATDNTSNCYVKVQGLLGISDPTKMNGLLTVSVSYTTA